MQAGKKWLSMTLNYANNFSSENHFAKSHLRGFLIRIS